jgi:hypothetical protein
MRQACWKIVAPSSAVCALSTMPTRRRANSFDAALKADRADWDDLPNDRFYGSGASYSVPAKQAHDLAATDV